MKKKGRRTVYFLARTGIIAGVYAGLTIALAPISYGAVQCRVSEALTLLPLLFVEAVPGLIIGCLIANIFSGIWADMVFGTLATAIAAWLTYLIGRVYNGKAKPFLGAIPPVAVNAVVLPLMWLLFSSDAAYWLNMGTVAAGQAVAVLVVGIPLYYGIAKTPLSKSATVKQSEVVGGEEKIKKGEEHNRQKERTNEDVR